MCSDGYVQMKVLVAKLVLVIPYSTSLKDKRRVLRGIKDRIWSKFRASVSEVEEQNSIQKAVLGVVYISNEKPILESVMNKIVDLVEATHPGLLHHYEYTVEQY